MLPESTELPQSAFDLCYDEPMSKEEFLESFDRNMKIKLDDLRIKTQTEAEMAEGIRWLYVRAEGIIGEIIKSRKEELGPAKSSQDKTINGLEEVGVILVSLASIAANQKLLNE